MRPLHWILWASALTACADPQPNPPPDRSAQETLPHHRRWSERVGQGAQPRGPDDFRTLRVEGYTTVLSVDGALPDLDGAHAHGLRYAHVPIGYDGVTPDQAAAIVKVIRDAPGPVYVHCHHGKHRGPAAAALGRLAIDRADLAQVLRDLDGTLSPSYPGLREDIARFQLPSAADLDAVGEVPEAVQPTDLISHMLEIDLRAEEVAIIRAAGWQADPAHPDLAPAHTARLLQEAFVECARAPDAVDLGAPFVAALERAAQHAAALEQALERRDSDAAEVAHVEVRATCQRCHADYRN